MNLSHASSSSLTSHSGKVLVVDDEPSVLAIASAILSTIGSAPLKARNGEDAVEQVKQELDANSRVSVVIMDLTMPGGMSGFETMESLRQLDPNIRVVACSGFFQEGASELCQSIGFNAILAKPYTPESLLSVIRRVQHESPTKRASQESRPADEKNASERSNWQTSSWESEDTHDSKAATWESLQASVSAVE